MALLERFVPLFPLLSERSCLTCRLVELLILIVLVLVSLAIIPFGLPGIWIMVVSAVGFSFFKPDSIGWVTLSSVTFLGVVAEVLEFTLAAGYAKKYGGSSRATWGAIIGGIAGTIIGVPVPLIGSIIGAFVGSFAGAFVAELSGGTSTSIATRVARGALIGSIVASAMKFAFGIAIAVWVIWAAWI